MHIPDGYLSPSTCAVMYAASAPCWWAALRRTRRKLSGRTLPLLSLFAAFSFVTMMFNLPLPGGTTGHAVGVGIAAIVLGPWASLIAISRALTIQALCGGHRAHYRHLHAVSHLHPGRRCSLQRRDGINDSDGQIKHGCLTTMPRRPWTLFRASSFASDLDEEVFRWTFWFQASATLLACTSRG